MNLDVQMYRVTTSNNSALWCC